ncbi:MAG: hypothetical protein EBT09_00185 [Actinobacteria bacterium]|nr:hypothetical protein [Actinomycetota bacterium]
MRTPIAHLTDETIALTKSAFSTNSIEKAITVAGMNLVGYNLEAPSKKLYPVLSPLRNRFPRVMAPVGSSSAYWKAITNINTTNVKASVAFGTRNASTISYGTKQMSQAYRSFGMEDAVDFEATWLSRGFEDVQALSALATLQALMIEEEKILLGGLSVEQTLGTPSTPVLAQTVTDGGAWGGTVTVFVSVMALPMYGYLNSDRDTLSSLGDHSAPSAEASLASVAATSAVTAVVAPVSGAFAYAWFVGTATGGAKALSAITTSPSVKVTVPSASGITSAAAGAADTSGDANAFAGLYSQILNPASALVTIDSTGGGGSGILKKVTGPSTIVTGALVYDMTNSATAIGGSALTSDGAFGIKEFDNVLRNLWETSRIGPTLMLMNSEQAGDITRKIGADAGRRIQVSDGDKSITGGIFVSGYLNKFTSSLTPGSPDIIPFMIHPFLPPGQIIFISERLPYPNNEVTNVFEVETQQEYADFQFALQSRRYEHGVYAMEALKCYFPAGCAVIRNIKTG